MKLQGQTALITGGSRGIGKAISFKFAEEGAKLAIFGTNLERGNQFIKELPGEGHDFYQTDVSSTAQVDASIKKVLDKFGQVDVLINNAGINKDQLLMKMTEENWDDVMAVNVKSCYNLCHALVRPMMKARKGKIINVSSVVGLIGNPGQVNYAASKGAMISFTKALARELAARNILVNCIAPGYIKSDMTDALNESQKENILAQIPLGRMGIAENVADAAVFLALTDYITGHTLTVDGGMTMY